MSKKNEVGTTKAKKESGQGIWVEVEKEKVSGEATRKKGVSGVKTGDKN